MKKKTTRQQQAPKILQESHSADEELAHFLNGSEPTKAFIVRHFQTIYQQSFVHIDILRQAAEKGDDDNDDASRLVAFEKHCKLFDIAISTLSNRRKCLVQAFQSYSSTNRHHQQEEEAAECSADNEEIEIIVQLDDSADESNNEVIDVVMVPANGSINYNNKNAISDPLTCVECKKLFKNAASLAMHVRSIHRAIVEWKVCPLCERKFRSTGDLTRHMRSHTGERPFHCSAPGCALRFSHSGDLNKHMRRHVRDAVPIPRLFVCQQCGDDFDRSTDLRRHEQKHRLNGRLTCDLCQKSSFYRKDHLRAHLLRHLRVRSFPCGVCGKSYADRNNCERHMLRVHHQQ